MYDSIDLRLEKGAVPHVKFMKDTPKYLDNETNRGKDDYGDFCYGTIGTLQVRIRDSSVIIKGRSICKYYLGDNLKTLSKSDTRKAIEKISKKLHLPFEKAIVTRIDFSTNMLMLQPVEVYLKYMGQSSHFKRLEQNEGLYYTKNNIQLVFYDKILEFKSKNKLPIPNLYKDQNVLRFEMRYIKRINEQFDSKVTGASLYNEKFYLNLVKRWRDEYFNIAKININNDILNLPPTGSSKELGAMLIRIALLNNENIIIDKIGEWRKSGEITKKQSVSLLKLINSIINVTKGKNTNLLITELDEKILGVANGW